MLIQYGACALHAG